MAIDPKAKAHKVHHEEEHHAAHGGHDEPHEEGEPWLVSYADLMTLLFGFFVLMYAFANAKLQDQDPDKSEEMVKMRKEVSAYFGGQYVTPLSKVQEEFQKAVAGTELEKNIDTKLSPEGLDIVLRSTAVFASGSADLYPGALSAIEKLIGLVKEKSTEMKTSFKVMVEGHTDDIPVRDNNLRFPSNWELSGARAATVIRLFESNGLPPQQLAAIGYGASRPMAPNRDENGQPIVKNQELNRRVLIKIAMLDVVASKEPATSGR